MELETQRLLLRPLRDTDLEAMVAYRSRPEVARYQSWDTDFSLEDARRMLETRTVQPRSPGWIQFAIEEKDSSSLCGDCGIHFLADPPSTAELGITLAPEYQGRGIGTEALGALVRWGFDDLELHRLRGLTDDLNHSMRKLFTRLGFRLEARFVEADWFKGEWSTLCTYALLRREWLQTPPSALTP
jgi:RimJ/RimL family protein N-acetyltransferase